MKKAALHNLGCKVNAYETEAMQEILEKHGYEIVPFGEKADVYLINTCSVTNIADRKSRQMLHRARKMNPDAVVIAAGCYVQAAGRELLQDSSVDILIGNNEKANLPEILKAWEEEHDASRIHDLTREHTYEELSLSHTAEHTRAYMKIQDGCNQFCTYCIIPYARGRVRSRKAEHVLKEVQALADAGYKEVVLTGIHLSSYGVDFQEEEKETLLSLILKVHQIDGIRRIRLGSLEPGIVTREFAQTLSGLPKICPHFHLSLQSGCDATLQRMNRRYRSDEYRQKCKLLREYFSNPALTTDVIVGFPMETEEEFLQSKNFVDSIHFYETHIFKYSMRQGTKAAAMEGQIPEPVKAGRSDQMLQMHHIHAAEYERSLLGQKLEVLLEEEIQVNGREYYLGHSKEYVKVAVEKSKGYGINDIITLQAEDFLNQHMLLGKF